MDSKESSTSDWFGTSESKIRIFFILQILYNKYFHYICTHTLLCSYNKVWLNIMSINLVCYEKYSSLSDLSHCSYLLCNKEETLYNRCLAMQRRYLS